MVVGAKSQPPHIRIPLRNQGFFITLLEEHAHGVFTEEEATLYHAAKGPLAPMPEQGIGLATKSRGACLSAPTGGAEPTALEVATTLVSQALAPSG